MFDNATLNNNPAGSSVQPSGTGDLVSTIDFPKAAGTAEGAHNTEGSSGSGNNNSSDDKAGKKTGMEDAKGSAGAGDDDAKGQGGKAGGDNSSTKGEGDEDKLDRFDKHPRFQELRSKAAAAEQRVAALEKQVESLTSVLSGGKPAENSQNKPEGTGTGGFEVANLLNGMDNETVLDALSEKPMEFLAGFAQKIGSAVAAQVRNEISGQREQEKTEERILSTLESYATENPDFNAKWESGEIKRFMEANPGHNAISAHMVLTRQSEKESFQKQIDDAVAKTAKETEERVLAQIKAKGQARSLGAGPSASPNFDNELKDTTSQGGLTAALAARSMARRVQGAA